MPRSGTSPLASPFRDETNKYRRGLLEVAATNTNLSVSRCEHILTLGQTESDIYVPQFRASVDLFRRRLGCSICADRPSAHFHASNAFSSIAWPSEDFWNTILAMRSSLSSSGKSSQERVCIRSRLRAVSELPLASAIRK